MTSVTSVAIDVPGFDSVTPLIAASTGSALFFYNDRWGIGQAARVDRNGQLQITQPSVWLSTWFTHIVPTSR
jgi:hypothetical protein